MVCIQPLPEFYRKISSKYWPCHPPIFPDCRPNGPTDDERELARELFRALDGESQRWYLNGRSSFFGDVKMMPEQRRRKTYKKGKTR